MPENLTRKILAAHRLDGDLTPGAELALRVDQVLLQDATGTVAWQQFETFGLDRVRVPTVVQYVDHNLLQTGYENADDHLFLQTMAARHGAVFSRPGNGISHFAHLERFDRPGDLLVGSDSHTCQAGAMGMLGVGAGGAEVAAVLAGMPLFVRAPRVLRVRLEGRRGPWVAAKDVILEVLRRIGVRGGLGAVLEYSGPGLDDLSVYERSTIANMGAETGATGTVFPADSHTRAFLVAQGRSDAFRPLAADDGAPCDDELVVDLAALEPLVALPSSPDHVVPVREVAGLPVRQVAVGSSVNSSYRDLRVVTEVLKGRHVAPGLHMTLSPGSRQILLNVLRDGGMLDAVLAGVRALEVACGPCIGMGAAPPTGGASVRTFNRNFRGRSGTPEDAVYLVSPETAAATAVRGVLTDPRDLGTPPQVVEPERYLLHTADFLPPPEDPSAVQVLRGPNIVPLPPVAPVPDALEAEVLIALGDDVSTDAILPGSNRVLPLRSNIPAIAEYVFVDVDPTFAVRARQAGQGIVVAGRNYGQGSSREHAALAPMHLGVRAVLAEGFARIHEANLVNYAVVPLRFRDPVARAEVRQGDRLALGDLRASLSTGRPILVRNLTRGTAFEVVHGLTDRQVQILLEGGLSRWVRARLQTVARQTGTAVPGV